MRRAQGFTLVELIIVIVLLGILSIGTFAYLGFGAQIFTDVVGRDQLTSQSRFAVERLTRELRNSLPGSARVSNDGRCLEFMPINATSSYLQLPRAGNRNVDFIGVPPANVERNELSGQYLYVYANSIQRIYGNASSQRKIIDEVREDSADTWVFEYSGNPRQFPLQSPARRYYASPGPVSWCLDEARRELIRFSGYPLNTQQYGLVELRNNTPASGQVVMAENLYNNLGNNEFPFQAEAATLQRSNLILMDFRFARREGREPLTLLHEVHIPNVP
ncbi:PilW family protein [Aliidiomarina sp. Khilg15.8]